jgi:hypothetical protein
MNRRLLIAAVIVLALIAGALIVASPFLALNQLRSAAEQGQAERLEQLVDFPAVRESLKPQLKRQLMARLRDDPAVKESPFGAFAMAIAPTVADGLVEGVVTPQAIAGMVREGDARQLQPQARTPAPATPDRDEPQAAYAYRSLNTFAATLTPKGETDGLSLVLERRGLIAWKLTRIELPPDLLAE